MIGNFGRLIVFETNDQKMLTFSGFTQKVSSEWSAHKMIGQKSQKEFNGAGLRSVTFTVMLDVLLGIRPRQILEEIEKAIETGRAEYLVIGSRPVSENKFVITSMSEKWDVIMNRGELARATISLSLEEYV